jgi:hypothetical protein
MGQKNRWLPGFTNDLAAVGATLSRLGQVLNDAVVYDDAVSISATGSWYVSALRAVTLSVSGTAAFGGTLTTTATTGFIYIPSCPGVPTGVPVSVTGACPVVVDSTDNRLYFYSGGAWRNAGP